VQFFSGVTQEEVARFARHSRGQSKAVGIGTTTETSLEGVRRIRINEVCFVATDSRLKDATSVAAQLAAASFGDENEQFKQLLNDPQKLLELIAAAEGTKGGPGGRNREQVSASAPEDSPGTGEGANAEAAGEQIGGIPLLGSAAFQFFSLRPDIGPIAPSGDATRTGAVREQSLAGVERNRGGDFGVLGGGGLGLGGSAHARNRFRGEGGGKGGYGRVMSRQGTPLRPVTVSEEEIFKTLSALTSFGNISTGQAGMTEAAAFQTQVADLPGHARPHCARRSQTIARQAPGKRRPIRAIRLAEL